MFESLAERFDKIFASLKRKGKLTAQDVLEGKATVRELAENLSREEAARRVAEAEKALEEAKKALSLMNHEEQEEIPVDNSEEKE